MLYIIIAVLSFDVVTLQLGTTMHHFAVNCSMYMIWDGQVVIVALPGKGSVKIDNQKLSAVTFRVSYTKQRMYTKHQISWKKSRGPLYLFPYIRYKVYRLVLVALVKVASQKKYLKVMFINGYKI